MDYKEETINVYDKFSEYFDKKFEEYKEKYMKSQLEECISLFPKNAKILDLGSGSGNHSIFFKQKGFDVLCLDISKELLKKCRDKGLKTIEMDIENFNFPENSFDVVWAYTSLLHIKKEQLPKVLQKIKDILKEKSFFFISLEEGKGENFIKFKEGGKRWFALYEKEEIEKLLKKDFTILESWKVIIEKKKKVFIDFLCKKN